jgi:histone acetyltransferase (RNA polymerase elongator complex component)
MNTLKDLEVEVDIMTDKERLIFAGGWFLGAAMTYMAWYIITVVQYKKKHQLTWLQAITALDR